MTDPSGYAKTLALPAGFDAPRLLRYDDVTAHAITRDDLAADVRGINASLDLSARPAAARGRPVRSPRRRDYVDLVRHECEFPDGKSFTFCVEAEAAAISAVGCAYLLPSGAQRLERTFTRPYGPRFVRTNRSRQHQPFQPLNPPASSRLREILDAPPSDHEITCRRPARCGRRCASHPSPRRRRRAA